MLATLWRTRMSGKAMITAGLTMLSRAAFNEISLDGDLDFTTILKGASEEGTDLDGITFRINP